ncbi:MAG TPA: JAB domain-containing protein, partial [Sedimenticola sp.]|nr:JAB domain-containing protein [Sedimenticola sp.]
MKTIRDWPEGERPREKLLQRGPQALSDAELLAIFLRTGIPGKTAVDLAREVLTRFGSLRALLQADEKTFTACKGLGSAKYVQLQAVLEMARRHLYESLQRGEALTSPEVTRAFLLRQLRDHPYEVFAALFLDTRHRLIAYEPLFRGTVDGASIHPREVARRALELNAV